MNFSALLLLRLLSSCRRWCLSPLAPLLRLSPHASRCQPDLYGLYLITLFYILSQLLGVYCRFVIKILYSHIPFLVIIYFFCMHIFSPILVQFF